MVDNSFKNNENEQFGPELIFGLVGAVGTDFSKVIDKTRQCLEQFGFEVVELKVSSEILRSYMDIQNQDISNDLDEFARIEQFMNIGNQMRNTSKEFYNEDAFDIIACGIADFVKADRKSDLEPSNPKSCRKAYIINSLKHPSEVKKLREIYQDSFYLFGIHASEEIRQNYLENKFNVTRDNAKKLFNRDQDENLPNGQKVRETFHLSDVFWKLSNSDNDQELEDNINRVLDIIFANPFRTPKFDEYAMYMAYGSALRSADLSRQVGAVIARDNEIIASGVNDVPKSGGGLYAYDANEEFCECGRPNKVQIVGRDFIRGEDPNRKNINEIVKELRKRMCENGLTDNQIDVILSNARLQDLTEFNRAVHAEMDAIVSCARNNVTTKGATMYTTTFPCHNCAKHIVAAGIERVVYIEPYSKSKAFDLHNDAIELGLKKESDKNSKMKVYFEPFIGISPRKFHNLFSMKNSIGKQLKRKDSDGKIVDWTRDKAEVRVISNRNSYSKIEAIAVEKYSKFINHIKDNNGRQE